LWQHADRALLAILFDPQTAGGFLAGIPGRDAESCVRNLRESGYAGARIIGAVTALGVISRKPRITLSHAWPGQGRAAD
jgi:selenide,water dikinase